MLIIHTSSRNSASINLKTYGSSAFSAVKAPELWNKLLDDTRSCDSLNLKTFLFKNYCTVFLSRRTFYLALTFVKRLEQIWIRAIEIPIIINRKSVFRFFRSTVLDTSIAQYIHYILKVEKN